MLHSIIHQARGIKTEEELNTLITQHYQSPINTTLIIEAIIRTDKYLQRKKSCEQHILHCLPTRDKKMRNIFQHACRDHKINIDDIMRQHESPKLQQLANTHEAQLLPTLQDHKIHNTPLHYKKHQKILIRKKKTDEREAHLLTLLSFIQNNIKHQINKNINRLKEANYNREKPQENKKPAPQRSSKDGSVYMINQKDYDNYHISQHIPQQQKLHNNPYFYCYADDTKDICIGTKAYKKAIISYTSSQARTIRFTTPSSPDSIRANIRIHQGICKNILFHAANQNDSNIYYQTNKTYPPQDHQRQTNTFFEQESGLSEISHLVSQHQDDVFRSSTEGTTLIEGVSGSGKSNLIFHRIDYLLQQFPEQFNAKRIAIITPNQLLEQYLHYSLQQTDFSFKKTIQTFHRQTRSRQDHIQTAPGTERHQELMTQRDILQGEAGKHRLKNKQQMIDRLNTKEIPEAISRHDQNIRKELTYNTKEILTMDINLHSPQEIIKDLQKSRTETLYRQKNVSGKQTIKQIITHNEDFFFNREKQAQQQLFAIQKQTFGSTLENNNKNNNNKSKNNSSENTKANTDILTTILIEKLYQYLDLKSDYPSFDYVLIDEFQDFHPQELQLLSTLYGQHMVLSGDCMQSKRYNSHKELEQHGIIIKQHKQLTDNFRNSLETLQFAHQVFGKKTTDLFLACRAVKRGPNPQLIQTYNKQEYHKKISETAENKNKNARDEIITIIYYNIDNAHSRINYHLSEGNSQTEISFPYQQSDKNFFNKKIRLISYEQSKGLESDHIILIDSNELLASTKHYRHKRYYIGCTRATRTLTLIQFLS